MNIKHLTFTLLLFFSLTTNAANTITKVSQVSTPVELNSDVDYVITSATPFTGSGKVDITNTDHAVLIIENIRPSQVISQGLLRNHVYINGEQAVNGTNCQVRMYAHGTIIFPYAKGFKPLTVFSEQNFEGTAVNDFGLENSGGFMNTLTEEKLNNKIRSFKLKRGYMVTFATGKSGWGYSRCFIADKEDLEFTELPVHLDCRISSYRVFQWHDAQKKGLASDTREGANSLLGTSWCYDWATGLSHLPDRECVPHQIYVAWPSASACGSVDYACHMKTNNEPGNSADDRPQDVETILNQWQELMRTGLRLCSESSHDGSWAHLDEFIAEIDRRGWRCDILDLHCYWASGFDNMEYYYNKYGKRPIWISEFVWGASWNNNGIFSSSDRSFSTENQQKNLNAMKGILTSLNNSPYVERYAYWNSEADCSKLLRGESEMSLTGDYYRDMNSGMAYRKAYEKIPNVVYSAPTNVTGTWANQSKGIYKLSWEDTNFDLLNEIHIQRMADDEEDFTTIAIIKPTDQNSKKMTHTFQDTLTAAGIYEYRVMNVTAENKMLASSTFKVSKSSVFSSNTIHYGELLLVDLNAIKVVYNEPLEDAPAVFMGTVTNNNTNLHTTNLITLASETGFTYTPSPWLSCGSVEMEDLEKIPFMSIPEGNHQFGSLTCEVGTVNRFRQGDTKEVQFAVPFPEGVVPVVLAEIHKPNNTEIPMVTKVWDITNTGFKCQIMIEDGSEALSTRFVINYMAITPGIGVADNEQGLIIAAGRNEEAIFGTGNRSTNFMLGTELLYTTSPYIFAQLQTNNYDAAAIIRKQNRNLTEDKDGQRYVVGSRFKRVVDPNKKTATDGTLLDATTMKDDLGWVVLYQYSEGVSAPTSIDSITLENAPLRPYVIDGVIYVDGCASFEVYNTVGIKLDSRQPQLPGVYVVRTANATAFVLVK